jgi:hypothetical protein
MYMTVEVPAAQAEEASVLDAVRRGDEAAFVALAERYRRQLHCTAIGCSARSKDAEDLPCELGERPSAANGPMSPLRAATTSRQSGVPLGSTTISTISSMGHAAVVLKKASWASSDHRYGWD